MPFVAALLLIVVLILAMPLLLVFRYRVGTARRMGRRWVATTNLVMMISSAGLFLWAAAITGLWVPRALLYSLGGLVVGMLLGLLGLALTRWERSPRALHYTPNRWLVLLITLALTSRLLYSLWRVWHHWRTTGPDVSWLASAGIAGSMAVGASGNCRATAPVADFDRAGEAPAIQILPWGA
jgi:hypothetical protein